MSKSKHAKRPITLTVVSVCVRCQRPTYGLTNGIGGCLKCDPHNPNAAKWGTQPTAHRENV